MDALTLSQYLSVWASELHTQTRQRLLDVPEGHNMLCRDMFLHLYVYLYIYIYLYLHLYLYLYLDGQRPRVCKNF